MVKGISVKYHLEEFNLIIMDLGNIDIQVESNDQALIVLGSLLPSYKTFLNTLLYTKDNISLDEVNNAPKSKELKKNFSNNKDRTKGKSLMARGRSQTRNNSRKKNFKARSKSGVKKSHCYKCNEQGHYRRDCPKLKRNKQETSAKIVDVNSSDDIPVLEKFYL